MRKGEIETRMTEIKGLLDGDTEVDVDEMETEMTELRAELAKIEKRKELADSIAANAVPTEKIERKEEQRMISNIDSIEYRDAFLKKMMGKELTEVEQRSVAAANVAGAVPTMTSDRIFNKLREIAPLLSEVTLLNVVGNVNFAVEGTNTAAVLHTENNLMDAAPDTLVTISLAGYEITKLVRISKTVQTMTINAFEGWLADLLAENIATRIEAYMILGTGSGQPKGIDYARSWSDGTTAVQWAAAAPTYAELAEQVSYLPGGYYRRAKWLMNHKTFWNAIQAIRDDAKAPIVKEMGNKYYIMGKEVLFSDYVNDGDVFIGDFKKLVANLAQQITVDSSMHSGFAYNSIDYRGTAIFDCDIAVAEAFVKGANNITAG